MSPRAPGSRWRSLVDTLRALHAPETPAELERRVVEDVERLVPGGAAAMFCCDPEYNLIERCAAGPRWRTAEQEPPGWLGPHCLCLSQVVRTANPFVGEMVFGSACSADGGVRELVQLPLVVHGEWWGSLVILRPADAAHRAHDVWVVEAYARHFQAALTRVHRTNGTTAGLD